MFNGSRIKKLEKATIEYMEETHSLRRRLSVLERRVSEQLDGCDIESYLSVGRYDTNEVPARKVEGLRDKADKQQALLNELIDHVYKDNK
jgi:hypothetical protein